MPFGRKLRQFKGRCATGRSQSEPEGIADRSSDVHAKAWVVGVIGVLDWTMSACFIRAVYFLSSRGL